MANNATLTVPLSDGVDTSNIVHPGDGTIKLLQQLNDGSSVKVLLMGLDEVVKDRSDSAHFLPTPIPRSTDGVNIDFIRANQDTITAADSADFDLGTGDFTLEGVFSVDFFPPVGDNVNILSHGNRKTGVDATDTSWSLQITSTLLRLQASNGPAGAKSVAQAFSVATEYHVEIGRSGNTLHFFVDGTKIGTADVTGFTYTNGIKLLYSGLFISGPVGANVDYHDGQIKWARMTKGTARHTANFTPPTYYNTGSSPVGEWVVAPVGTIFDYSTLLIDELNTANTSVLYDLFESNAGPVASGRTIAQLQARGDHTSTDTNGIKIVPTLSTTVDVETPEVGVNALIQVEVIAGGDFPAETDVRLNVDYNNAILTGSAAIPGASDVRDGVAVDATTGTAAIPGANDVRQGVPTDDTVGNYVPAEEGNHALGDSYGSLGTEFTGTKALTPYNLPVELIVEDSEILVFEGAE